MALKAVLQPILSEALVLTRFDKGNIQPVAIADVCMDEEYLPYRQAAADAGYRSVISLPLIAPGERLVGVLSVHRAAPGTKERRYWGFEQHHRVRRPGHHAASIDTSNTHSYHGPLSDAQAIG